MGVPKGIPPKPRPTDNDGKSGSSRIKKRMCEKGRAKNKEESGGTEEPTVQAFMTSRVSGAERESWRGEDSDAGRTRVVPKKRVVLCAIFAIQLIGATASTTKGGHRDIEVNVKVPTEARLGSSVELKCDWRLLGENSLYSVKWYKDDHEFFRYVPDDNPKIQTFTQPGINLDKRSSSEKSIRLRGLELTSAGQYKCEVSTEAPSFATTYRTGNLTVIVLPERGPEITGLSSHYAIGENVTANCTAWPSVPKPTLRWTINGKPVPTEKTIRYYQEAGINVSSSKPLSVLGLRLEAEPRLFENADGSMIIRIKCIVRVGSSAFEASKEIPMAYVNNQRLSAGEIHGGRAAEVRTIGTPLWSLLLLPVLLFTT